MLSDCHEVAAVRAEETLRFVGAANQLQGFQLPPVLFSCAQAFKSFLLNILFFGNIFQKMGTLKIPDVVPSPTQDAERLNQAFKGWGTDEKAVISVLGHRNAAQREKIREAYQELYNHSLIDALDSELSGEFRNAIKLWAYDPAERDARLANAALKSKNKRAKELQVIVEIACASSPNHLIAVRQAYCSLFECSLEEDIVSDVSPPMRKLLVSLVSSYRYDKEHVDMEVACSEAAKLHGCIESKQLDHDDLVRILATRNYFQLKATFDCYQKVYGKLIDQDVFSCGNGDMEALLSLTILCIACPENHFAEVIRASIVGLGTDEDSLTRAIVTRAEVDMAKIKDEYANANKETLERAVRGDTSGDYQDFLLTLIGEK